MKNVEETAEIRYADPYQLQHSRTKNQGKNTVSSENGY